MSCCGKRRANLMQEQIARRVTAPRPAPPATDEPQLRCRGGKALCLRGPHSGRAYRFLSHTAINVDARDFEALLRTGLFEPV